MSQRCYWIVSFFEQITTSDLMEEGRRKTCKLGVGGKGEEDREKDKTQLVAVFEMTTS